MAVDPVAIDLGFTVVRWYGVLAALAMGSGLLLALYWGQRYGLPSAAFEQALLYSMIAVIVGARLGFVVANWSYFAANPGRIWRIDLGGLGSQGAILVAFAVGYLVARRFGIDFGTGLDSVAASIPLAHAFVRLGNFINGELYGLPTALPWGRVFPGSAEPRHPSMLYEGLLAVVFFAIVMRWAAAPRRRPGEVFLRALLLVSAGRFAVELTRTVLGSGAYLGMSLTQALAAAIGLACVGGLWRLARPAATVSERKADI